MDRKSEMLEGKNTKNTVRKIMTSSQEREVYLHNQFEDCR